MPLVKAEGSAVQDCLKTVCIRWRDAIMNSNVRSEGLGISLVFFGLLFYDFAMLLEDVLRI